MLRVGLLIILLCIGNVAFTQHGEPFSSDSPRQLSDDDTTQFEDGKDYFSYVEPVSLPPRLDKVLIEFFFDYDCRVCSSAQDVLELYVQINRDKVALVEHPVATAKARFSASVFYSLQHLEAEHVSSALMFETAEKPNYIRLSKMDNLLPWLETQGIERNRFLQVYHSEKVKRDVDYAIHLTEDYGVFTFPYVVINGKYVLTASTLYNDDYTLAVLDYLINKKE